MRSLLFVPGNSAKMIVKASASAADVIILDLEDAVHPDAKPEARKVVVEALAAYIAAGTPGGTDRRLDAAQELWARFGTY